ncbi:MAG: bifunctional phosphopantothenoylcysteine decarboxylase/phosphopantothenate--cysteine ligase CoaBC [Bacteroidetes bacterium]|nr:bifunctional phosphopantothenoylcysteine decarboxylase/phosphopantothenate--cysteine ligase CoaBC [Bacteroidota bacterium]
MVLKGKRIILGITGSIAAYKSAFLIRSLIRAGAEVKVIMTNAAKEFITPLTISTLSKNPVISDFFSEQGTWTNHVELGIWADLMLIAPASANTLAAMANGICDNMLLATYLSAKCPVYVAPAMDLDMWAHLSTQENIEKIQSFGNSIIKPGTGDLASGLYGEGRMAEPEEIINFISSNLKASLPLSGKKILITAGPTYEAIDPVRFIGNHSSGKMGFAIAEAAARKGADVTLVAGPVSIHTHEGINRIDVQSAHEMLEACNIYFDDSDIAIFSAAVADYKPKSFSSSKIKKSETSLNIELEPTKDILAGLGKRKKDTQILIGFALETDNEVENAKKKLISKNLDMIVLNSLNDKGAGFKGDTNKVTFISKGNIQKEFGLKTKQEVAIDIIEEIISLYGHA